MHSVRIEVLHPGVLTSVQEAAPKAGGSFYGIPQRGPLDAEAAALANFLLGNPADSPTLECNFLPPRLRFSAPVDLVVTGANCGFHIDGCPLPRNRVSRLPAGRELSGTYSSNGVRAYIAFAGRLAPSRHAPLNRGDALRVKPTALPSMLPPAPIPADYTSVDKIPLYPGPEWELLTGESRDILLSESFAVGSDSDRVGARLRGPRLNVRSDPEMVSVPVVPGIVQLPRSGHPIVVLHDGPTTGGYPRIGVIRKRDLSRFNQIQPNQPFFFAAAFTGAFAGAQT